MLARLFALALASLVLSHAGARAQCEGDDCEAPRAPSSYGASDDAVDPTEMLWPESPPSMTGVVERPYLQRGRDFGFMTVGITALSVGLSLQLMLGAIDQLQANCRTTDFSRSIPCDAYGFGFIPFAGSVLVGTQSLHGIRFSNTIGVIGGPILIALQAVGLAFLLYAVHGYTVEVMPGATVGSRDVRVLPFASPTEAGLTLSVDL